jgi:hypothetical protein
MPSYTPAQLYPEDQVYLIIHVFLKAPLDELDEKDLDDSGRCVVAGKYRIAVRGSGEAVQSQRDQALEIFHAHNLLSDPDAYQLMVSTYNASMDRQLVADLGVWLGKSEQPRCFTHLDCESIYA